MGRAPCCSKDASLKRGAWTAEEDMILTEYITVHGDGGWKHLSQKAGLKRCGKSCRMRWLNYLRPGIKRGNISPDEEDLIIRMHSILGNRWSLIAGRLPGRTDNEIKNYWNTQLIKKLKNNGSSAPETKKIIRTPSPQMEESQITRTAPVRTTAVRIENYSNKHVGNSATSNIKDFRFQGGSAQAVSNSSKSWCELWADELLSDNDFDLLDITTNQNIVEAKSPSVDVNGQLSPFSVSRLINDQIPHSQDSPENEISTFKTSLYSNDLSSPDSNLFCSPSVSSEDLRMEQLEEMPSNDMEETQTVESFGSCNEQAMEEILNDMVHQVEWGGELLYFNMSSPKSPSLFQG